MSARSVSARPFHFSQQHSIIKSSGIHKAWLVFILSISVFVLLCALFYIWSRIQIVKVGYEINRELKIKEQLVEENKKLSYEIATLKSPLRLEALAKKEYRMALPEKAQILDAKSYNNIQFAQSKVVQSSAPPPSQKKTAKNSSQNGKKEALRSSSDPLNNSKIAKVTSSTFTRLQ